MSANSSSSCVGHALGELGDDAYEKQAIANINYQLSSLLNVWVMASGIVSVALACLKGCYVRIAASGAVVFCGWLVINHHIKEYIKALQCRVPSRAVLQGHGQEADQRRCTADEGVWRDVLATRTFSHSSSASNTATERCLDDDFILDSVPSLSFDLTPADFHDAIYTSCFNCDD